MTVKYILRKLGMALLTILATSILTFCLLRAMPGDVFYNQARDLSRAERDQLKDAAEAVIIKDATSPERLLEETVLFLHRVEADLPPAKRKMLEQARLHPEVAA